MYIQFNQLVPLSKQPPSIWLV